MGKKLSGSSTIAYQGTVTIKSISTLTNKVTRKIQRKNAGHGPFFEAIAMCISGKDWSKYMPRFLRGYDINGVATISSYIPYNLPVVKTSTTEASVRFEFLIPFTQLDNDRETTELRLFNSAGANSAIFASIDLPSGSHLKGTDNTNHLVVWTIKIGNK